RHRAPGDVPAAGLRALGAGEGPDGRLLPLHDRGVQGGPDARLPRRAGAAGRHHRPVGRAAHRAARGDPAASRGPAGGRLGPHRNWAELVGLLDKKAQLLEGAGDRDGATAARREAASISTDQLTDRKASIARWEWIQTLLPRDLDALRALEKLYAQEGTYSE